MDDNNKKFRNIKRIKAILTYGFLVIAAIAIIIPFYWMVNTAFKTQVDLEHLPPLLLPTKLSLQNFYNAFQAAPFATYFKNTIIVAFFSTLGTVFTTVLAAFAFSRLSFRGRDTLFSLLLTTMMIPGEMMIITNFVTISRLGWKDQYAALIIPFTASVFYIFFLRQSFKQIPDELYLAAKVDGTSDFKYLWRVMIPIAKPTIITITILSALGSWNAYIWPNLVTDVDSMRLVTNGLRHGFSLEGGGVQANLQMAAATLVTLPILIIFLLLRKYIMRGVSRSGIKG